MAGTVILKDQLRQLSSFFGLDPATLATVVHSGSRTPNGSVSPIQIDAAICALTALQQRLDTMFASHDGVERWLHTPSGYFGGGLPFDYLVAGKIDRVNAALDAIEAGVFV